MTSPEFEEQAVQHDWELIKEVNRRLTIDGEGWHTAALEIACDNVARNIVEQLFASTMKNEPGSVSAIAAFEAFELMVSRTLELFFTMGHDIGEGNEHILKCSNPECKRSKGSARDFIFEPHQQN